MMMVLLVGVSVETRELTSVLKKFSVLAFGVCMLMTLVVPAPFVWMEKRMELPCGMFGVCCSVMRWLMLSLYNAATPLALGSPKVLDGEL